MRKKGAQQTGQLEQQKIEENIRKSLNFGKGKNFLIRTQKPLTINQEKKAWFIIKLRTVVHKNIQLK